ncbi:MAG TPA: conjugal transfer protein TraG, partial [Segatella copri]|nr:conjugal transfer protein TraG [Segatella copri]
IPIINDFKDTNGNDCMKQAILDNYNQIKEDVKLIVKDELERIAGDESLKHLIQK